MFHRATDTDLPLSAALSDGVMNTRLEAAGRAAVDQAGQGRVQDARRRAPRAQGAALVLHHLPALGAQLRRGAQVGRVRHAALVDAGTGPGLRQGARGAAERGGRAGGGRVCRRLQVRGAATTASRPLRPQERPGHRGTNQKPVRRS